MQLKNDQQYSDYQDYQKITKIMISTDFRINEAQQPRINFPLLNIQNQSSQDFEQNSLYQYQNQGFSEVQVPDLGPIFEEPDLFTNSNQQQNEQLKRLKQIAQQNQNQTNRLFSLNPISKHIMKKQIFNQKNGNTIRFLVDIAVQYLPSMKHQFQRADSKTIQNLCLDLRSWHLAQKKNVYNREHLLRIFTQQYELAPFNAKQIRKLFSKILQKYALLAMKRPRSQIKDHAHYLRMSKQPIKQKKSNKMIYQ